MASYLLGATLSPESIMFHCRLESYNSVEFEPNYDLDVIFKDI